MNCRGWPRPIIRQTPGGGRIANATFHVVACVLFVCFMLVPGLWPLVGAVVDGAAWKQLVSEGPRVLRLLSTTARIAMAGLLLAIPTGLLVATLLFRITVAWRRLWWSLLATAAFSPLVLYVGGWQACVGPYGWYRAGAGPTISSIGGWQAASFVHALASLPWVAAIIGLGLLSGSRENEEQALLDAGPLRTLIAVTLPAARPAVLFACLFAIVPVLTDMTVSDLFLVRTFAEEVYTQFETGGDHVVALMALLLSLVLAVSMALAARRVGVGPQLQRLEIQFDRPRYPLRGASWTLAAAGIVVFLGFAVPVFGLVRQLGLEAVATPDGVAERWSASVAWSYLYQTLSGPTREILPFNIAIAGLAACVSVAVAGVLAWQWRWSGPFLRTCGLGLACWLLVLPGPVLALGMIEIFNHTGVRGNRYMGIGIMIFGQVVRSLPIAAAILACAFYRADRTAYDAAALDGVGPWRMLTNLALPLCWPAVTLAFLITMTLCLTEFAATVLLYPAGVTPMSVWIFQRLHNGTGNEQAALCLLVLAVVGCMCLAGTCVARRMLRQ